MRVEFFRSCHVLQIATLELADRVGGAWNASQRHGVINCTVQNKDDQSGKNSSLFHYGYGVLHIKVSNRPPRSLEVTL